MGRQRRWGWQVQPSSLGFIQVHQAESFDDVSSLPGWWQSARGAEGGRRGTQEPDGGSWGWPSWELVGAQVTARQ